MLIVGGGNLALQKLHTFANSGAHVTLVAPEFHPGLLENFAGMQTVLIRRPYQPEDVAGKDMIYAATDDRELNRRVYTNAERAGISANAVDDPGYCDFYTPSVLRRGAITLALSTSGRFPGISKALRECLESWLPCQDDDLLQELFALRTTLKRSSHATAVRSHALRTMIDRFKQDYLDPVADPSAIHAKR